MIVGCTLCPRRCGVDRTAGQVGACGAGGQAVVASAGPHFGEEPQLVGADGSGTIFLAGCNLHCVFCQNSDISRHLSGHVRTPEQIAELAVALAARRCVNINFVTPSHVAHAVAGAIVIARARGLDVPIVYNCGGYESLETLELLDGLIDIYMPDFKYASSEAGWKYSGVDDYPPVAAAALAEMYRQVGPLTMDASGAAGGGLLVRHLVMPGDICLSRQVIETVAKIAPGCTINVMGQYRPAYRAEEYGELATRPDAGEVLSLQACAENAGLKLAR